MIYILFIIFILHSVAILYLLDKVSNLNYDTERAKREIAGLEAREIFHIDKIKMLTDKLGYEFRLPQTIQEDMKLVKKKGK